MSNKDASARPSTMMPHEKLRRRQQMQAVLAIQRQQQQFRHQVLIADQYITQNCCQGNPLQLVEKSNLEGLIPSFDPNSSLELGDSGNFSAAVDNSSEFSVLYRLQDVVAKVRDITLVIRLARMTRSAIPKEKSRYRPLDMLAAKHMEG
ncbi:hypothetical protein IGI04_037543 [Brassica rapa subsp. trilocularis]|uniref:Uncharacterized protein n=1 Tax=Brassica rapa subsp. trilocularis TaxID=1813537 RepID=A0ABQ7LHM8_BRACM|nr:hypothetical protein IGI04_037543 [Brassica rapa subsp. trilocularis]